MTNLTDQRIVFFDLDGTLHQQDMFGCFLCYLLRHQPINGLLVIPVFPVVVLGLLLQGRATRWPMSLLLWSITFGHSEAKLLRLQRYFVHWFRQRMIRFPLVQQRLDNYLSSQNVQIWIITGSPKTLVEEVYSDTEFLSQVRIIGSKIYRRYGGWILNLRCLGYEKVVQLQRELGIPLKLYSGYSDSIHDSSLLYYCKQRWRVTHNGQLKKME